MSARKTRLVDCNPRWVEGKDGTPCRRIAFDCPEGHVNCWHSIPFTPALDGVAQTSPQRNGAQWTRRGDSFATLVLSPSIRRVPEYASRAAALKAGCRPDLIDDSLLCAFHGFIGGQRQNRPGEIEFCGDSR